MTNWRDYERNQFEGTMAHEARRQNDLLSAQLDQAREVQKEKKKQRFEDRIAQLRLALAQASEDDQKEQIQILLVEAQEDYQKYLDKLMKERQRAMFWSCLLCLIGFPLLIFGMIDMTQSHKRQDADNRREVSQSKVVKTIDKVATKQTVTVVVDGFTVHQNPSFSAASNGVISSGTYTITETKVVDGYNWGKLESGQGWIALDLVGDLSYDKKQVPRRVVLPPSLVLRRFPSMMSDEVVVTTGDEEDTLLEIVSQEGYQWAYLQFHEAWVRLDYNDIKRVIGSPPAPLKQSVRVPDKDTKNLTTAEVANWAKATTHIKRAISSGTVALEGMTVDVWMADDGLVYANLSATGFPFVDEYRINHDGYLELKTIDGKNDWQVVSETYTYIQP